LGSPTTLRTDKKILYIEDTDEYLYHVDRMMINLKRNGYFDDLAGMIVGNFTDMNDNDTPFGKAAREIILDVLGDFDFPIVFDFPAGHLADNRALLFGKPLEMTVNETEARLHSQSE
jgi:muramoyltetrapeptide carboxypeptidase